MAVTEFHKLRFTTASPQKAFSEIIAARSGKGSYAERCGGRAVRLFAINCGRRSTAFSPDLALLAVLHKEKENMSCC